MKNVAIKVQKLSKVYKLYDRPINRLKEALSPLKKKYHKEFYALHNINFLIKKGETVGIIGHNGAGKSTLLKIITGVLTPTSGHIHINGKIASLLELGAGFNPEYTGLENIFLQGTLIGYSHNETEKKLDKILQFADIGEFINQPVKSYSSGMFARLAFAIAINVDPDILIVDEALSVGDMNFQAKCMTAMDKIKQNGTTILFVSHDINSVKSLCEKGIYINKGELIAIGKASDIAEIYIQDMQLKLNNKYKKFEKFVTEENTNLNIEKENRRNKEFKFSKAFEREIAQFRYGTGEIKVQYVEVLNSKNELTKEIAFNEKVKINIYIQAFSSLSNVAINFQLLDDKRINITMGGFRQHKQDLLKVNQGELYVIEYELQLPLQNNNYTLQTIVASYINGGKPILLDVIPNAFVFKIREKETYPLGSKVDLFPEIKVTKIKND